ncbi:polysaccharide deacetylase family protein [Streptococcus constellatus]|uniref:polysaccharide deacetylase family protein n=1 Tax=Streptococcus constellatus TaxID=76860 RepID=UPI001183BDCD|nr:polysaccharide deacetylase family protein [Streptococcus constellatus]
MKKIVLIVLNITFLSIIIFGSFQIRKLLQERKLNHQIAQILKKADKTYNQNSVRKQVGRAGSRFITSYYPLTENKQDIDLVKEKINADIRKFSNKKSQNLEIDRLVFYISQLTATDFSGVKKIAIKRISYPVMTTKVGDTKEDFLDFVYISSDNKAFNLNRLFKNVEQAKKILLEEIQQKITMYSKAEGQKILQEFQAKDISQWTFSYEKGKLSLFYKNDGKDSKVEVSLSALYEVIDEHYLMGEELAIYQSYQAKKHQKLVALTFDDGPNAATTPQALDILSKYHVKGTFFMLGKNVAGNEQLVKRVHDEGHEIGNHSWSHPQLPILSLEQAKKQIADTQVALRAVIGESPKLMRPPYGAINDTIRNAIDMSFIMWNVDSLDWKNRNTMSIMQQVKKQTAAGSIILMHDIHQTTINALPSVIEYLQKNGYTFVTVSELLHHQLEVHRLYYGAD